MKNVLLAICLLGIIFFSACDNECEKWKRDLTAEDSVLLFEAKAQVEKMTLTDLNKDTISEDSAKTWVSRFLDAKTGSLDSASMKGNAWLSAEDIHYLNRKAGHRVDGIFVERGLDEQGNYYWIAWVKPEEATTKITYFKLSAAPCTCPPCCPR